MTPDQQIVCDRTCLLYTCRIWDGSLSHLTEATDRQAEAVDILTAHTDWLSDLRARVEATGQRWNTHTCRAQSRRDGDLAAPPEWIGKLSEELTPEWLLNQ